jgi:SAM-dependent methyltransferase
MSDLLEQLPPNAFQRADETRDDLFYRQPRLVTHIDDNAIAGVTTLYRQFLPEDGRILDLMSSWISHLPADVTYREIVGHGMNTQELSANPRLDQWFIQNLNETPQLPLEEDSFDGAAICVSIQYLTNPAAVMADLARILNTGAPLIVTFSHRCFPTKAVAVWQSISSEGHGQLVKMYLAAGGFEDLALFEVVPPSPGGDPLYGVVGRAP